MSSRYLPPAVEPIDEAASPLHEEHEEIQKHEKRAADVNGHGGNSTRDDRGRDGRVPTSARSVADQRPRHRPRSATARRASPPLVGMVRSESVPSSRRAPTTEMNRDPYDTPSYSSSDEGRDETSRGEGERACQDMEKHARSSVSTLANLMGLRARSHGSGSSSGSASTITQTSFTRRESQEQPSPDQHFEEAASRAAEEAGYQPDALSFLDPDSPALTEESIQRSVAEVSNWRIPKTAEGKASPSARSSSSSSSASSSSVRSDGSSGPVADHETDRSSSPEQSIDGDATSPRPRVPVLKTKAAAQLQAEQRKQRAHRYGTPEMPRGNANLPHLPPNALNPRVPNQGHVKHLPRAEKLPLTGYELLASRLSCRQSFGRGSSRRGSIGASSVRSGRSTTSGYNDDNGPQIKPIYRRFEVLNHRLLLHLQDELSELEEQLHRLDTADTQTRRLQNSILPASRRAEHMAGGELQWHKTDILGKVGYKLGQYNHVLSSFTETQKLPAPSLSDVETYRTYLATQQPIAEIETRFLDPADDLVSLAARGGSSGATSPNSLQGLSDDALTPMPRAGPFLLNSSPGRGASAGSSSSAASSTGSVSRSQPPTAYRDELKAGVGTAASMQPGSMSGELPHLALSVAVAVLVPILTFAVIPGFVGRMTVVLLVALAVFGAQVQAGTAALGAVGDARGSSRDLLLCAGVYGGVMAVVAGLFS